MPLRLSALTGLTVMEAISFSYLSTSITVLGAMDLVCPPARIFTPAGV
jgi:hypothetical protein